MLTVEVLRDVLQLRDVVLGVAAVLLEQREDVVELRARVRREELLQGAVDHAPRRRLLRGVGHAGNRLAAAKVKGQGQI